MTNNSILVSLNGVGWNAKIKKATDTNIDELVLQVGYSHPICRKIPTQIEVKARSETLLEIKTKVADSSNLQKQLVGDFVASIRRIRPWNIYTGHGIIRRDRTDNLIRRRGKRK